jgi:hypothetical protein
MEHDVAPVHELADDGARQHGVHDEVKARLLTDPGHVLGRAGGEVVEREDLPALFEQQLGQVRPDKPGTPGDECTPHDARAYLGRARVSPRITRERGPSTSLNVGLPYPYLWDLRQR